MPIGTFCYSTNHGAIWWINKNSGASWRKYFYLFLQIKKKIQFVKSIVYLLEQVQCICLDLCIYNILRITEETSSKHHMTTTYMEPPREEKRKAEKHVAEKHRKRKKERWATLGEKLRKWPQTDKSGGPWSMAHAPSEQTGQSK